VGIIHRESEIAGYIMYTASRGSTHGKYPCVYACRNLDVVSGKMYQECQSLKDSLCTLHPVGPAIADTLVYMHVGERGGGLGSRPKKMYGERLGDGVEYHLMSPTPRR